MKADTSNNTEKNPTNSLHVSWIFISWLFMSKNLITYFPPVLGAVAYYCLE
jgi:hypothetical protein